MDIRVRVPRPGDVYVSLVVVPDAEVTDPAHATRRESITRPGRWDPVAGRQRLLAAVVAEAVSWGCSRARWPELAAVIRDLAANLDAATHTPGQSTIPALTDGDR